MTPVFPLNICAHRALRARLAALMALVLLVTGMLALRPAAPASARNTGHPQGIYALAHSRQGAQLGTASRPRQVGRRGARYEEIHQHTQALGWPDQEKGAAAVPRFFIRKLPSDQDADGESAAPQAFTRRYQSRAPPAMG